MIVGDFNLNENINISNIGIILPIVNYKIDKSVNFLDIEKYCDKKNSSIITIYNINKTNYFIKDIENDYEKVLLDIKNIITNNFLQLRGIKDFIDKNNISSEIYNTNIELCEPMNNIFIDEFINIKKMDTKINVVISCDEDNKIYIINSKRHFKEYIENKKFILLQYCWTNYNCLCIHLYLLIYS